MKAKLHDFVYRLAVALGLIEAPRLQPVPVRRSPPRE